jgi:hypothetical protein
MFIQRILCVTFANDDLVTQAIFPVLPVSRPVFLHTPKVLNTLQVGNPADVFEPHVQVGISRLHKKGYRCKGINIAVIDTGCDCQHPALGKGFGKGFKIAKGYDFVGDAYNGSNLPIPDGNPCTSCAVSAIPAFFASLILTMLLHFFLFRTSCMVLTSWVFSPLTRILWAFEEYAQMQQCPLTEYLAVRKTQTTNW